MRGGVGWFQAVKALLQPGSRGTGGRSLGLEHYGVESRKRRLQHPLFLLDLRRVLTSCRDLGDEKLARQSLVLFKREEELDQEVELDFSHSPHGAAQPALEGDVALVGSGVDRLRGVGAVIPNAINQLEAGQRLEDGVDHRRLHGTNAAKAAFSAQMAL